MHPTFYHDIVIDFQLVHAPVLGGVVYNISDANNALEAGGHYISTGTNCPEGHMLVYTMNIGLNRKVQYAFNSFTYTVDKEIYYRRSDDSGSFEGRTWSVISRDIPTFYKDYASLSELSTALNIFKNNKLSDIPDSQTLNSTFSSGIYQVGYSQHYGVLVVFSTSYYIMQLYIDNGGQFKKRINTGNNPDAWVGDTI